MLVTVNKKIDLISFNLDNFIQNVLNDPEDLFMENKNIYDINIKLNSSITAKPQPQLNTKLKPTIYNQSIFDIAIERNNNSIDNLINTFSKNDFKLDEEIPYNLDLVYINDKYYATYTLNKFKKGSFSSAFSSSFTI